MFAFGGCTEEGTPDEIQYLNDFHKAYFVSQQDMLEEDNFTLYVDYSTCISQAMGDVSNSAAPFYVEMVPNLVNATKTYWSIKGSTIAKEQGNVYSLLKSVTEVNYAD